MEKEIEELLKTSMLIHKELLRIRKTLEKQHLIS